MVCCYGCRIVDRLRANAYLPAAEPAEAILVGAMVTAKVFLRTGVNAQHAPDDGNDDGGTTFGLGSIARARTDAPS